ncbi:MAG: hypothetical protein Ct9H90mP30_6930 [Actinomycetota bacterium]|nr:MAG: hypothetical protein Ct9H90mP30_6930 [Actinomycetota bacterium]
MLREMRETQIHFALVGQSDSQFIGLITLEDVLEAIVGEIVDESDKVRGKPGLNPTRLLRGTRHQNESCFLSSLGTIRREVLHSSGYWIRVSNVPA